MSNSPIPGHTRIETNHGHDWVEVTATRPDDPDYDCDAVDIKFTGRDPVSVSVRYTDIRNIAHALLSAANYLAPDEPHVSRSSAGNDDEAAAKLINQYLGMSDIDAEDADYFRAVMRDTRTEPQNAQVSDQDLLNWIENEASRGLTDGDAREALTAIKWKIKDGR